MKADSDRVGSVMPKKLILKDKAMVTVMQGLRRALRAGLNMNYFSHREKKKSATSEENQRLKEKIDEWGRTAISRRVNEIIHESLHLVGRSVKDPFFHHDDETYMNRPPPKTEAKLNNLSLADLLDFPSYLVSGKSSEKNTSIFPRPTLPTPTAFLLYFQEFLGHDVIQATTKVLAEARKTLGDVGSDSDSEGYQSRDDSDPEFESSSFSSSSSSSSGSESRSSDSSAQSETDTSDSSGSDSSSLSGSTNTSGDSTIGRLSLSESEPELNVIVSTTKKNTRRRSSKTTETQSSKSFSAKEPLNSKINKEVNPSSKNSKSSRGDWSYSGWNSYSNGWGSSSGSSNSWDNYSYSNNDWGNVNHSYHGDWGSGNSWGQSVNDWYNCGGGWN